MKFFAVLSMVLLAGCANAQYYEVYHYERIGRVVAVEPITRTEYVTTHQHGAPRCRTTYSSHESSTSRVLFGAVLGAALGNRIGGGSGRDIATATGAVVGGSIAADSGRHFGAPQTVCYNHRYGSSYGSVKYVVGYLVRVNDRGYTHTIRMNHPPRVGSYIRY